MDYAHALLAFATVFGALTGFFFLRGRLKSSESSKNNAATCLLFLMLFAFAGCNAWIGAKWEQKHQENKWRTLSLPPNPEWDQAQKATQR